jgi:carbon-monoxide dehydrogenase small subunit
MLAQNNGFIKTMNHAINITINGHVHQVYVPANLTLLDLLRHKLGLTGTKKGCDTGDCGSCTVIVNGKAINACLCLAVEVDGCKVETIEGLQSEEKLHPLQDAFVDHGAVQCGFCTPGMIMASKALLDEAPNPGEEQIKEAIAGNLCRCTGYQKIIEAVTSVAGPKKEPR